MDVVDKESLSLQCGKISIEVRLSCSFMRDLKGAMNDTSKFIYEMININEVKYY